MHLQYFHQVLESLLTRSLNGSEDPEAKKLLNKLTEVNFERNGNVILFAELDLDVSTLKQHWNTSGAS